MGLLEQQQGLLPATANPKMLAQALKARNQPRTQLTGQGLLDTAAIGLSPVPIVGDALGLLADGVRYANDPSSRTPMNFGLTALGALPFVPPASAIFGGVLAKTAKLDQKAIAEGMEKAGRSRDDIWKETGWFKGPEGKWKFEIDDSGAQLKRAGIDRMYDYGGVRQKTFMPHDQLHSAYPDTADIWTRPGFLDDRSARGVYDSVTDEIALNPARRNPDIEATKSTNLHEMQHAIQGREGFARGGGPAFMFTPESVGKELADMRRNLSKPIWDEMDKYPLGHPTREALSKKQQMIDSDLGFEAYRRLAGEAEARAVQSRMNMNQQQRQATPPWQSYDVPWEQLIVK